MKGIMQLYYKDNALLAEYRYDYVKERKRVMEVWRRRYAKHFIDCYFIIIPLANSEQVMKDGYNFRSKRLKFLEDINLEKPQPKPYEILF